MGNANARVANHIGGDIVVMTFNNADTVFQYYHGLYQVVPGQESTVEAAADAWGLNIAIGYATVGNRLLYRRWFCPNGDILALEAMNGSDMQTSGGCEHKGTGDIDLDADTMSGVLAWATLAVEAGGAVAGASGGGGRDLDAAEVTDAAATPSELVDEASPGGRLLRGLN